MGLEQQIGVEIVEEWRRYYVQYTALKQIVKQAAACATSDPGQADAAVKSFLDSVAADIKRAGDHVVAMLADLSDQFRSLEESRGAGAATGNMSAAGRDSGAGAGATAKDSLLANAVTARQSSTSGAGA